MSATTYRRRTEVIEAMQYTGDNAVEVCAFSGCKLEDDDTLSLPYEPGTLPIGAYISAASNWWMPDQFSALWAEVTDAPTLTERVEALEQRIATLDGKSS